MDPARWSVRQGGRVEGPMDEEALRAMIRGGRARPWMEFSADGGPWTRGSALPHLFPPAPAPEAPPDRPRAFRGSGAVAKPIRGLIDPDAWSRRWGTVLGAGIVLGAVWPLLLPSDATFGEFVAGRSSSSFLPPERSSRLVWPWDSDAAPHGAGGVGFWLSVVVGALAIVVSRTMRGTARAVTLLAATIGSFVVGPLLSGDENSWGRLATQSVGMPAPVLLVFLMFFSVIAIAVGNHVRKRFPDSPAARMLAGLGGIGLVAGFLLPIVQGHPLISLILEFRAWGAAWPLELVLTGTLAYGVLGFSCFSTAPSVMGRCALLSLLGRCLAFGFPGSIVLLTLIHGGADALAVVGMAMIKVSLSFYGYVLLVAVALAAWIDAALLAKSPQPLDPTKLAQVFR